MADSFIGIDYSGRGTATTPTAGLQVYWATEGKTPQRVAPNSARHGRRRNWCRQELTSWLLGQIASTHRIVVGLDFSFSLPMSYFQRYGLRSWDAFLLDFAQHWPTDQEDKTVEDCRSNNARTGSVDELRLTERWTSSAKSNFQFDVQGQVAKSTHAGIPWLRHIRSEVGSQLHFWPFDGWQVPSEKSLIAEVYPSILRRRFPREDRTVDQHDAFAIASWLQETSRAKRLEQFYCNPPLTAQQRKIAKLEGWILGIM